VFSSCSFNKAFLAPIKIPAGLTKAELKSKTDTTFVSFDINNNYQPTFLKGDKDTIALDYTIESFAFTSKTGNKLNGWLLKPKNAIPAITLLHFHGNGGVMLIHYKAIIPLVKHGFQIFTFDYSGFGFSEGKATRANVLIDALSAVDYVKTRKEIKNTKLVIYGQSLGGHLAAVVAAQKQKDIDGLVVEGGFSSHKDIAAKRAGFFGRILVKEEYSALESIGNYKKPSLFIHSSEDEEIPFELGKKLFAAANQPKEFYEIKKCHICGTKFYANEISEKIKEMLSL